jgi:hypothetical protein
MIPCQNCGKLNSPETNFCRFCGTKFTVQAPMPDNPYDYSAPRPYVWKTDEFPAKSEARPTAYMNRQQAQTGTFNPNNPGTRPAPLAYAHPRHFAGPFRCSHCMSQVPPRVERRISTAGWITFAILLVLFFPLFWIGLLIKEDVYVCQTCNSKVT